MNQQDPTGRGRLVLLPFVLFLLGLVVTLLPWGPSRTNPTPNATPRPTPIPTPGVGPYGERNFTLTEWPDRDTPWVRSEFEAVLPPPAQAEFVSVIRLSGISPLGGPVVPRWFYFETIYYRSSSDHSVIADYYRNLIERHGWEVIRVNSDHGFDTQPKGQQRPPEMLGPDQHILDLSFWQGSRYRPRSSFTYYLESDSLKAAVWAMRGDQQATPTASPR